MTPELESYDQHDDEIAAHWRGVEQEWRHEQLNEWRNHPRD